MKRTFLVIVALVAVLSAKAQADAGTWRIYPKVGVALTKLYGDQIMVDVGGEAMKAKYKQGLTAGADLVWQMQENAALSLGLMYANCGTRYGDYTWTSQNVEESVSAQQCSLHYLQMPLMGSLYVSRGLAVKIGVQPAWLLKAQYEGSWVTKTTNADKSVDFEVRDDKGPNTSMFHRFDFAIPVGISYETGSVMIDVRYNFGVTKTWKPTNEGNNRGFVFTVGYGFDL